MKYKLKSILHRHKSVTRKAWIIVNKKNKPYLHDGEHYMIYLDFYNAENDLNHLNGDDWSLGNDFSPTLLGFARWFFSMPRRNK